MRERLRVSEAVVLAQLHQAAAMAQVEQTLAEWKVRPGMCSESYQVETSPIPRPLEV